MSSVNVWTTISFLLVSSTQAANILVFLPLATWSHYMQYELLYETLATRGHSVTVYSPYPPKQNLTNFRHVYINNQEFLNVMADFDPLNQLYDMSWFLLEAIETFDMGNKFNKDILTDPKFRQLVNSKQSFDLVMIEPFFWQEATIVLGHIFQAPVIHMGAVGSHPNMLEAMGGPNEVAYMPEIFSYLSDRMTFLERIQNLQYTAIRYVFRRARYWYLDAMVTETLGPGFPSADRLFGDISLCFLYSATALEFPHPLPPNMIQLGGLHLQRNRSLTLPQDLQKILDGATHGFILFSLGTVITPTTMKPTLARNLMTAFSRLSQYKILWKWSGEPLAGLPSNVVQLKWIPQIAVLAHPRCKLFITHGGLSSQLETVYHGVPVVTIPFFGDQFSSATKAADFGFGVHLRNTNLTSDALVWSVNEVLSNPRYKAKVLERSKLLRDWDASPLSTAVYWTEYAIQFKGAAHLAPASRELYWFQYYLLDVLAAIVATLAAVLVATVTVGRLLVGRISRKIVTDKKGNGARERGTKNKTE